jgi:hypothetical protein
VEWVGFLPSGHEEDEQAIEEGDADVDCKGDASVLPSNSNFGALIRNGEESFVGFEDVIAMLEGTSGMLIGLAVLTVFPQISTFLPGLMYNIG